MTNVTNKNSDWLPAELEARAQVCAALLLQTTVTDPGYKDICLGAGVGRGFGDRVYTYDLGFERSVRSGKLFMDGGEGTDSGVGDYLFQIRLGRSDKSPFPGSDRVKPNSGETISEKVFGIGWQGSGGGSRSIGGEDLSLNSDTRALLYMGSSLGWGAQLYLGEGRWYLEPAIFLDQGTYYPLVDADELGEFPGAGQNIAIRFGLKLGYGDLTGTSIEDGGKGKKWDKYDDVFAYYGEVLAIGQRILNYQLYAGPGVGENEFYEDIGAKMGGASQQTEDVPVLLSAQAFFKGLEIANFGRECHAAHESESPTCYIRVGIKGLTGLASLFAGEALLSESVGDFAMAANGALSMIKMSTYTQILIESGLGMVVQAGGALGDSAGVALGGTNWLSSVTLKPDRRESPLMNDSATEVSLKPYIFNVMGAAKGHPSAAFEIKRFLNLGGQNQGAYTRFELETHAIYPGNVGARFENIAGGDETYSLTPSIIRTGGGYKFIAGPVGFLLGAHTFQEFGGDIVAGAGAGGTIDVGIPLGWEIAGTTISSLNIGAGVVAEKAFCDGPECEFRLQFPLSVSALFH